MGKKRGKGKRKRKWGNGQCRRRRLRYKRGAEEKGSGRKVFEMEKERREKGLGKAQGGQCGV